jgi:hypothetical protein
VGGSKSFERVQICTSSKPFARRARVHGFVKVQICTLTKPFAFRRPMRRRCGRCDRCGRCAPDAADARPMRPMADGPMLDTCILYPQS